MQSGACSTRKGSTFFAEFRKLNTTRVWGPSLSREKRWAEGMKQQKLHATCRLVSV